MAVPYEMPPQGGLVVNGGASKCFTFVFPGRCIISKIVIKQTSGVLVNFTAALFNHPDACAGEYQSESDTYTESGQGAVHPDAYRVTPDLAGTGGSLIYFSDAATGGHGFIFFNQDKFDRMARLGNTRKIYVRITPAGTGPKTFSVGLGCLAFTE